MLDVTKMSEKAYACVGCYSACAWAKAETFPGCSNATPPCSSSHQHCPMRMGTTPAYNLQKMIPPLPNDVFGFGHM